MKKLSSFILILLLLSIQVEVIYARGFSDTKTHWAKNYIDKVTDLGYMSGYSNSKFDPDKNMTKAEFYSVINQMSALKKTYTVTFSDVSTNDWFYNDIAKAIKAGYLVPTTGKLYPNRAITREEVCEIFGYMYSLKKNPGVSEKFEDKNDISKEAKGYIGTMVNQGVISGFPDGNFYPKKNIKRAEVAKLITSLVAKYNTPTEKVLIDSKIKFGDRNLYE